MKNESQSLIYNTDKQLKEHDSKLGQELKDRIRADISVLNEAVASNNHETLKNALEKMRKSAMEMGTAIYQNSSSSTQQSEPSTDQTTQNNQQESTGTRQQGGDKQNKP